MTTMPPTDSRIPLRSGRFWLCIWLGLLLPVASMAEDGDVDLEATLTFESSTEERLEGWGGNPPGTVFSDSQEVHGGERAARLERDAASGGDFTAIAVVVPRDFEGEEIELRGWLKTREVSDFAGLWLREDGPSGAVAFDNMQNRQLAGTTDWTEYRITLPLEATAERIVLGALLAGTGSVWVDDLALFVDGEPFAEVPRIQPEPTVLDLDQEFDEGSGIEASRLTARQIRSLSLLGRVWGFVKYHHPRVTRGELHWDWELFRVLPEVLEAEDDEALQAALLDWLREGAGDAPECDPCAEAPAGAAIAPGLKWIRDRSALGSRLSRYLVRVHESRPQGEEPFYVSLAPGVGNPVFSREPAYDQFELPDTGFRILALYRLWNVVRYWFPYRDLIDEDWDAVLSEFLPRMVEAADRDAYRLALIALSARIDDGHANLWRELDVVPPRGECRLPVTLRSVEGRAVVVARQDDGPQPDSTLQVGDALVSLDGRRVEDLLEEWSPWYPASNSWSREAGMMRQLPRGPCGEVDLEIERDGLRLKLTCARVSEETLDMSRGRLHDLPGPTFRRLSDDVAYVKLSSASRSDARSWVEGAAGARGLIIDIRNYPSDFMVFALGQHLVAEETPFVRFTVGDLDNPGAFHLVEPLTLKPEEPRFEGRVIVLVDESSLSQAEYTTMAFRAAPEAMVIGGRTAGADGNVSPIPLPGGLSGVISGIGVFYPDGTPTQQVGIVPDIEVHPTVAGIAAGRDEVLERALRELLGPDTPESHIRSLARPEEEAPAAE